MDKKQYILNIREDFHRFVGAYFSLIAVVEQLPQATEDDKCAFELFRQMLKGKDVSDIEKAFSDGDVNKALDKIAKLYKDLSDFALDHINESPVWKQVVRQATHQHIDDAKKSAKEHYECFKRI